MLLSTNILMSHLQAKILSGNGDDPNDAESKNPPAGEAAPPYMNRVARVLNDDKF